MTRRLFVCLFALAPAALAGCGGEKPPAPEDKPGPGTAEALADLAALLKDFQAAKGKPPANAAAFAGLDAANPAAASALARKEIVYYWGHGITAGGTAVIAHDAKTPTDGGPVLLQDGTVKTMTAGEFAAAPKAKK